MFMLPLFALLQQIMEPIPFFLHFFFLQKSLHSGDFNCYHSLSDSKDTSDPRGMKYLIGSSLLTSYPSMSLTYLHFSIAPLSVVPPLTSPLLSSLAFSCSWVVLHDLSSDHLLTIPLSPVFRLNERPSYFNYQKAL